jgi:beta-galactosidase
MKTTITLLALIIGGTFNAMAVVDNSGFIAPRYSPWPAETAGVKNPKISLNGIWKFDPDPKESFFAAATAPVGSVDIKVPGEWSMQGFTVQRDTHAGYFRTFKLPKDWVEKRVKVRFDGVYSDGIVYVNGKKAGHHEGGFTPFELDITDLVKPRERNVMTLAVCNESAAERLASGSKYASHVLGGISRKVTLFALPEANLAALFVTTDLDEEFKDAVLQLDCTVANESPVELDDATLLITLLDAKGKRLRGVEALNTVVPAVKAGEIVDVPMSMPVVNPAKWTSETPTLYQVQVELKKDGKTVQRSIQTFGFRKIEVQGNQVLVNGQPVKLRGVCRHEVHPLTGRSLSQLEWEADARLYREANVNLIRTSHYPPPEEFIEWCNQYGLWVECEAPFCWSQNEEKRLDSQTRQRLIVGQNLEMVTFYKNHPSILYWSLANESLWNDYYAAAGQVVKREDPTRPRTFNFFPWSTGWHHEDEPYCDLGSDHYPGPGGADKFKDANRPINFGEYLHLNSYNRFELASDPGLRDAWGRALVRMWDDMFKSPGVLGGSLWAAMDDEFHMPDGTVWGYGQWGPLDAWRRAKPEYYHMKKTYSPVRIQQELDSDRVIEQVDGKVILDVLNQSNHSNLKELEITWNCGRQSGPVVADVAPHATGKLIVAPASPFALGSTLELVVKDNRGFPYEVDRYHFSVGKKTDTAETPSVDDAPFRIVQSLHETEISHPSGLRLVAYPRLDYVFKLFMGTDEVVAEAPHLMILPLNPGGCTQLEGSLRFEEDNRLCSNWKSSKVTPKLLKNGDVEVTISGEYKEAAGGYVVTLSKDGSVTLSYDFTMKTDINPRQVGVVYILNRNQEKFTWSRQGQWSIYPVDHIGRNNGTAWPYKSLIDGRTIDSDAFDRPTRTAPEIPWCLEGNLLGTHDFRSTKENVITALFENETSGRSFRIQSDGTQAVRAWVDGVDDEQIRVLVADYVNMGRAPFFHKHVVSEHRPLKRGDKISGMHQLQLR